tara:strand:- start:21 stop:743 length:723 start_codon:yes stop_codon:yes gene_type:complete
MVSIDTVYQRVLALANKEQRGYITPQEFNLFANQAQMDIFEQYFYDLNQFRRVPGNDTVYADMVNILEDKIDMFRDTYGSSATSGWTTFGNPPTGAYLPDGIYRMEQVRIAGTQCEKLTSRQYNMVRESPLTRPTTSRPIYTIRGGNSILINDGTYVDFAASIINVYYIRKPNKVNWSSYTLSGSDLYDSANSDDFELHDSEETKLVIKILGLAGITLKDPALYQIAGAEDNKNIQQEKQ